MSKPIRPPRCECARTDCGVHHGNVPCGRVGDDPIDYDATTSNAETVCLACQTEAGLNHPEEFGLVAERPAK